jgi:hypothetical protein
MALVLCAAFIWFVHVLKRAQRAVTVWRWVRAPAGVTMLYDGRTELLVSGEAIWFGVGLALLMARMGVFPGVARWACSSRSSPDA